MSKKELYTVRTVTNCDNSFFVEKFDSVLLLPTGHYFLQRVSKRFNCDCPAGNRPVCRHRELVEIFIDTESMDSGKLYDYDKKRWSDRIAPTLIGD